MMEPSCSHVWKVPVSKVLRPGQVQAETLNLAPRSTAGILWVAKHWREAKTVALTIRGWDDQEMRQLIKVLKVGFGASHGSTATSMQQVKHIALHLESSSNYFAYFELSNIIGATHTPWLESLCIACGRLVWFKECPVPTLKHLRLDLWHQDLLYIMHRDVINFQVFSYLETLTICCDIGMNLWGSWDLKLAEMKRLRCVSLQMALPRSMSVSPDCQVHFVCHSIPDASKVWGKGLGTACTSCHLMELVSFEQAAGQPSLHQCLRTIVEFACPNLTVLKLTCSAVGSQEEPLKIGESLPALRELEIRALDRLEGMYVWVGANLPLESLTLCSKDMLEFHVEDMNCLLSGLRRFRYAFGRCCMMTGGLIWHLRGIRNWTSVARADGLIDMHKAGALDYSGVALETSWCKDRACGTCIDCLRRKHLPVSDNTDWPFIGLFAQR